MSLSEVKRHALEKRRDELMAEYQAAQAQLGESLGAVEQTRLKRQIEQLEREVLSLEAELSALAAGCVPASTVGQTALTWPELVHDPAQLFGQTIAAYDLMEFLGKGGSGLVFKAAHITLGRPAAIKIFYPLDAAHAGFYSLFEKGMRALGALDHPYIVKILDFGSIELGQTPTFYLAMEYVDGRPLDAWSHAVHTDAQGFSRRLTAAIHIAEALQAAHETTYYDEAGFQVRGVLHGDIKPANILLNSTGKVQLLDFLLVDVQRLLDPRVIPARVFRSRRPDRTTAAFGTPGFMAPEQERQGIVTVQTDIYGLGVTLMHLFCPDSDDPFGPFFATRKEEIPQVLKGLVGRMISSTPADRPTTMQEVAEQLRAIETKPKEPHSLKALFNAWRK
ncbi:MAG TPA: protein kinase [Anaerolineae bacterium]|mgnify:CR=1 FL=1|nr:protein kinase [Anaerolineae bacterium]